MLPIEINAPSLLFPPPAGMLGLGFKFRSCVLGHPPGARLECGLMRRIVGQIAKFIRIIAGTHSLLEAFHGDAPANRLQLGF